MIVDLFSGPDGWGTGLRMLGRTDVVGIEKDSAAVATATAAGHTVVQDELGTGKVDHPTNYLRPSWLPVEGIIASPPCPGFSAAGLRKGIGDFPLIFSAVATITHDGLSAADDCIRIVRDAQTDARSALSLEPLRWVLDLQPQWTCWEQVPTVLPLWEACADALRANGYAVWTGKVHAEQYGVPQARTRAVLVAKRQESTGRNLTLEGLLAPVPTHSRYYSRSPERLDEGVLPWVSMRQALDWGMTQRPSMTVTGGGTATGGAEPFGNGARKGMQRELAAGRWEPSGDAVRFGNQEHSAVRTVNQPAATIRYSARMNACDWVPTAANEGTEEADMEWSASRPSPTIVGSFAPHVVAAPGYRKAGDGPRQKAKGSIRVTVQEAGVLQSFPADYPWQGSKTKQFQQVGNAVPPLLAAAILKRVL